MPFKQMENIGNYLNACAKLGLRAEYSFQTVDLFEDKDMGAVVRQLHAFGRLVQKLPDYTGPTLGVKETDANKREFTEEQLMAAKGASTEPLALSSTRSIRRRRARPRRLGCRISLAGSASTRA